MSTELSSCRTWFEAKDYDLAKTLTSGQAFRWRLAAGSWEGVIGKRWVRLTQREKGIEAETSAPQSDWLWLRHYLQVDVELRSVLATFPNDKPMRRAAEACHGLRLLRQDPWECLASFILSSTKQIVQIEQIVHTVCERFGEPVPVPAPATGQPAWSFPSPKTIADVDEAELRGCRMGFRAPYLKQAARMVAEGEVDLAKVAELPLDAAREELMKLPGVGLKIADCVLLFAFGFPRAFPVDVWILKALRQLYFPRKKMALPEIRKFAFEYFGPWGGYAQQYLFHYMRTVRGDERA